MIWRSRFWRRYRYWAGLGERRAGLLDGELDIAFTAAAVVVVHNVKQVFERCVEVWGRFPKAIIVAFPRRTFPGLLVPNLDLVEAGTVIVAAEIEIDGILVVKLARALPSQSRLCCRDFSGGFGSPSYAREEALGGFQ